MEGDFTIDIILKKNNIKVAFTPPNTIRSMVDSNKDPRQHKGVYSIPCLYGKEYIG